MTITEKIKGINKLSTQVVKKENEIKAQGKSFQDLPVEEQNAIRKLQFEQEKLEGKKVSTKMSEFIEELAKYWGVARENMKVEVKFNLMRVGRGNKLPKERYLTEFKNSNAHVCIDISGENRHISFIRDFNPDLVQADGRTFGECVSVARTNCVRYDLITWKIDNPENFVFESSLYSLLRYGKNGKVAFENGYRKIILKMALEKEKQSSKENSID